MGEIGESIGSVAVNGVLLVGAVGLAAVAASVVTIPGVTGGLVVGAATVGSNVALARWSRRRELVREAKAVNLIEAGLNDEVCLLLVDAFRQGFQRAIAKVLASGASAAQKRSLKDWEKAVKKRLKALETDLKQGQAEGFPEPSIVSDVLNRGPTEPERVAAGYCEQLRQILDEEAKFHINSWAQSKSREIGEAVAEEVGKVFEARLKSGSNESERFLRGHLIYTMRYLSQASDQQAVAIAGIQNLLETLASDLERWQASAVRPEHLDRLAQTLIDEMRAEHEPPLWSCTTKVTPPDIGEGLTADILRPTCRWLPWEPDERLEAVFDEFLYADHPFCWMGVTGKGGAGKTRLAIEQCLTQAARGWRAGFLRSGEAQRWFEQSARLFKPTCPTLLVVDYAMERFLDQWPQWIRSLGKNDPEHPVRLVLLDRPEGFERDRNRSGDFDDVEVVREWLFRSPKPAAEAGGAEEGALADAARNSRSSMLIRPEGSERDRNRSGDFDDVEVVPEWLIRSPKPAAEAGGAEEGALADVARNSRGSVLIQRDELVEVVREEGFDLPRVKRMLLATWKRLQVSRPDAFEELDTKAQRLKQVTEGGAPFFVQILADYLGRHGRFDALPDSAELLDAFLQQELQRWYRRARDEQCEAEFPVLLRLIALGTLFGNLRWDGVPTGFREWLLEETVDLKRSAERERWKRRLGQILNLDVGSEIPALKPDRLGEAFMLKAGAHETWRPNQWQPTQQEEVCILHPSVAVGMIGQCGVKERDQMQPFVTVLCLNHREHPVAHAWRRGLLELAAQGKDGVCTPLLKWIFYAGLIHGDRESPDPLSIARIGPRNAFDILIAHWLYAGRHAYFPKALAQYMLQTYSYPEIARYVAWGLAGALVVQGPPKAELLEELGPLLIVIATTTYPQDEPIQAALARAATGAIFSHAERGDETGVYNWAQHLLTLLEDWSSSPGIVSIASMGALKAAHFFMNCSGSEETFIELSDHVAEAYKAQPESGSVQLSYAKTTANAVLFFARRDKRKALDWLHRVVPLAGMAAKNKEVESAILMAVKNTIFYFQKKEDCEALEEIGDVLAQVEGSLPDPVEPRSLLVRLSVELIQKHVSARRPERASPWLETLKARWDVVAEGTDQAMILALGASYAIVATVGDVAEQDAWTRKLAAVAGQFPQDPHLRKMMLFAAAQMVEACGAKKENLQLRNYWQGVAKKILDAVP